MKLTLEWRPRTRGELLAGLADALETLTRINVREIASWGLPAPYAAGARYAPEDGSERWLSASIVLSEGEADCEDWATYLAAWRRLQGDRSARAIPMIVGYDAQGRMLIHIVVVSRRGVEDPSVVLGMNNYPRLMALGPVMEGIRWSRSLS